MDPIQAFLIDSIKQKQGYYQNVIKAQHPYPLLHLSKECKCQSEIHFCTSCNHWVHIKCNGTPVSEYNTMMEANTNLSEYEINNSTWDCSKCMIIKTSKIFPFGL